MNFDTRNPNQTVLGGPVAEIGEDSRPRQWNNTLAGPLASTNALGATPVTYNALGHPAAETTRKSNASINAEIRAGRGATPPASTEPKPQQDHSNENETERLCRLSGARNPALVAKIISGEPSVVDALDGLRRTMRHLFSDGPNVSPTAQKKEGSSMNDALRRASGR